MPFTDEQRQKISEALSAKREGQAKGPLKCPICNTDRWNLADDVVRLTLQPKASEVTLSGSALPLIAIICLNCGNTHLLNVFVLGLADLLGLKPRLPAVPESQGKANG